MAVVGVCIIAGFLYGAGSRFFLPVLDLDKGPDTHGGHNKIRAIGPKIEHHLNCKTLFAEQQQDFAGEIRFEVGQGLLGQSGFKDCSCFFLAGFSAHIALEGRNI